MESSSKGVTMRELAIGIAGAGGRMGRMLVQAVHGQPGMRLGGACEHPASVLIGQDAGSVAGISHLGVPIVADHPDFFSNVQVVIDFTLAGAALAHLEPACAVGRPLVIGATGIDGPGKEQIRQAAQQIPIVFAPNFSVGVNLMFQVAAQVAKILGDSFDIEIIEAHHRLKVDAPSGTAMRLGEVIADALERNLAEDAVYGRQGMTGIRSPKTIGFATVRGGDIVGDHTALFAGEGERLEITHRATSRMTFAKGAVRAALWVADKPPGLYDMGDILGLR